MPVSNSDIARIFRQYGTLLEIEGANPFRVRAYQNAARLIDGSSRSVADLVRDDADLTQLEGIGKDLAGKIREIVETGHLSVLDELQERSPATLVELTDLPGLGARRVRTLHDELGIGTLEDLEKAARAGRVRELSGFGATTEQKILDAITKRRGSEKRFRWIEAEQVAEPLVRWLRKVRGVKAVVVAGSFRRCKETVGDLDILVTCSRGSQVVQRFVGYEDVEEVVSQGTTRSTVRLGNGFQVDLRVVPEVSYGAALLYFTGSKAHNIELRARAVKQGLKLSEYGLFKGNERIAGRTEPDVYRRIRLPYIEPELRENRGEIEAAARRRLPELIEPGDLKGDLHCHSSATDGRDSIGAMARAAQRLGYRYLAISDHTRHLRIANGLDVKRLSRQMAQIDRLNAKLRNFRILKSAEVDILEDGSLDLPDDILCELDVVTCAVHDSFDLPRRRQTDRIIRALDNPYVNILAHPTCRLIGKRDACDVDMERLMEAALERGCFLEVNAQPERLDLNDVGCRLAHDLGLKVAICTDAHSTAQLANMRLGVAQARRGWLGAGDVINTLSWPALRKLLRRR